MDQSTTPLPPHHPFATPRRRRSRRLGELTAVGLLSAALATGGTWGAITLSDDGATAPDTSSSSTQDASVVPVGTAAKQSPDWNAVTDTVAPSVVAIGVASGSKGGEGSGVIIDQQGHVLTNNHVVAGAGDDAKITVTLDDGSSYAATVAGTDPSTDLAVITITDPPEDLITMKVGSSSGLTVGDPVMAVGNPLGLAGTVTTGIVSALDRPVTTSASESRQQDSPFAPQQEQATPVVTAAIQTSAAVNPGNSGGALVDAAGRLVGINSSIATLGPGSGGQSGSIGIGFAIPVDEATWIAEQLIEDGSAEHAFLGVTPVDGTSTKGAATRTGAKVGSVSEGSPAADAGLQAGDLVVGIDDSPVTSAEGLVGLVHARRIDSTVTLEVVRDGETKAIEATLGTAPTSNA